MIAYWQVILWLLIDKSYYGCLLTSHIMAAYWQVILWLLIDKSYYGCLLTSHIMAAYWQVILWLLTDKSYYGCSLTSHTMVAYWHVILWLLIDKSYFEIDNVLLLYLICVYNAPKWLTLQFTDNKIQKIRLSTYCFNWLNVPSKL